MRRRRAARTSAPRPLWPARLIAVAAALLILLAWSGGAARAGVPSGDDGGGRTAIKVFVPWQRDGTLNPALTVSARETLEGNPNTQTSCQVASLATTRPDAWRCVTADPCFEPPLGRGDLRVVACSNGPWLDQVVILDLAYPLPTPQECRAIAHCRPNLDLTRPPWALELANGARCLPYLGTSDFIAGVRANYYCLDADGTQQGVAVGEIDRSDPTWRIFYLPDGGDVMAQAGILVAWY